MTNWWEIHNKISEHLASYYINNPSRTAKRLAKDLLSNPQFRSLNKWAHKFESPKEEIHGFDPFHIFASFHGNMLSFQKRQDRINAILLFFGEDEIEEPIEFMGCPTPMFTKTLYTRNEASQDQIWNMFYRLWTQVESVPGLDDIHNLEGWDGIGFSMFTIFLFWVQSDHFLPMDQNVTTFLSVRKLYENVKDFHQYRNIISEIHVFNFNHTGSFGINGLFREISFIAYEAIAHGNVILASPQYFKFLASKGITGSQFQNDRFHPEIQKLGFKLVSIEVLAESKDKYIGVLRSNYPYIFDSNFTFDGDYIYYNPDAHFDLYNIRYGNDFIRWNTNAIVGENGTGKSTLVELLFRIINNLAHKFKNKLHTNNLKFEPGLSARLHYVLNGQLFELVIQSKQVLVNYYDFEEEESRFKLSYHKEFGYVDFQNFFYCIAVNYSIYGLNELELGEWVERLFHKNDSYQTPIVINPMRTEGNININVENELVKSRLVTNLLSERGDTEEDSEGLEQLTVKQKAFQIGFFLNADKTQFAYTEYNLDGIGVPQEFDGIELHEETVLPLVCKYFEVDKKEFEGRKDSLVYHAKRYIFSKLIKITRTYSQFNGAFKKNDNYHGFVKLNLKKYISDLSEDKTHVTLKLRQSINFLKYRGLVPRKKELNWSLDFLSNKIAGKYGLNNRSVRELNMEELLPPPIYSIDIKLKDEQGNISYFNQLSSGEKQQIHGVNSLIYHLRNIDSAHQSKKSLVKYNNVLLLLDEIELYYHPKLQQNYIAHLRQMIGRTQLSVIRNISICLITHSPFILSDLESRQVLYLKIGSDGKAGIEKKVTQTFGTNIHDLLADSFFMGEEGMMGQFAKEKIKSLIDYLDSYNPKNEEVTHLKREPDWTKEKAREMISIIGEPILQKSLWDLYSKKVLSSPDAIQDQIKYLQKKLKNENNRKD